MNRENVRSLEDCREGGENECERLTARLYELMAEWESLSARKRELERQFIQNDLCVESGPAQGRSLRKRGRAARLAELLQLQLRTHYLESALAWTEQRRIRLLRREAERDRGLA